MSNLRLAEGEYRFARIVWENEPLPSGRLVELSLKELGWKKSTTYTVLKKLVDRGILRNENAVVSAAVPREAVLREESRAVVDGLRRLAALLPGPLHGGTHHLRRGGRRVEGRHRPLPGGGGP